MNGGRRFLRIDKAAPAPSFARHETFHLRYGWLKKCYDAVLADSDIFQKEEAPVVLGVGKNMAKSIRFWGLATKIIKQEGKSKYGSMKITEFGKKIFDNIGFDPYLEHMETLWLLHWKMLAPPTLLPAWWIALNEFGAIRYTVNDLVKFAMKKIETVSSWKTIPKETSIKKDIDAFVHTYALGLGKNANIEDYLDCPFRNLHLIKRDMVDSKLQMIVGKKIGISPAVVTHACLDFIAGGTGASARSMSLNTLATEFGGPGMIFKITEIDLENILIKSSEYYDVISVERINGSSHIIYPKDPKTAADAILDKMYKGKTSDMYKVSPIIHKRRRRANKKIKIVPENNHLLKKREGKNR